MLRGGGCFPGGGRFSDRVLGGGGRFYDSVLGGVDVYSDLVLGGVGVFLFADPPRAR